MDADAYGGISSEVRARLGGLAAVLDPAGSPAKNIYIDGIHARALRQATRGRSFRRALDFGCGNGRFLTRLATVAQEVCGVDPTPLMLETAQAGNSNVDLRLWRAGGLPYPDASFDLVLSVYVLSILTEKRFGEALEQISRANVPSGTFVAIEQLDNDRGLDEAAYHRSFERVGFEIVGMRAIRDGNGSRFLNRAQHLNRTSLIRFLGALEMAMMRNRRLGARTVGYLDYLIVARRRSSCCPPP